MISRMCLYVRLLGSLGKNLITRIGSELADCLVATKQCIVYRLCGCFCKSTDDDDVGSETPVTSQPESIHQLQPDECPDGEYDLTAEIGHQAWFHRVDRRTAQEMVRNGGQGCFLVRPSGSGNNALTLTLWHRHRPFNILIRHREDGLFALGTRKQNEPAFASVEELVRNYHMEELILFSRGERAGKTLLTSSPVYEESGF
ncbi:uncharacterized protein LOC142320507 isoform X1 [Lycorma delicatula]|uniref:uncharacterized protein LOC142320507 isoform X1 n=1 Tax=Lycorma delicatula TaxID=130591 RepID=UPI003F514815